MMGIPVESHIYDVLVHLCSCRVFSEPPFTSKERDSESGNDYFGARYYASSIGQFISPDPKIGSAHTKNPQSWNRYSYSLDNPLKFTDPDGEEAILFYRQPDPNASSAKDFGHVFLFVRNDSTGRSGFFDYYPDAGRSAVHRSVPASRIADHAALIIQSTPEAEDRMLDKMDELAMKNPPFNAGSGGWFARFWNALTGNVNDCVTTSEQILAAGGIRDSSITPTGLWDDLYTGYSNDPDLQTDLGAEGMVAPRTGSKYGTSVGHRSALDVMSDAADEERQREEEEQHKPQPQ